MIARSRSITRLTIDNKDADGGVGGGEARAMEASLATVAWPEDESVAIGEAAVMEVQAEVSAMAVVAVQEAWLLSTRSRLRSRASQLSGSENAVQKANTFSTLSEHAHPPSPVPSLLHAAACDEHRRGRDDCAHHCHEGQDDTAFPNKVVDVYSVTRSNFVRSA